MIPASKIYDKKAGWQKANRGGPACRQRQVLRQLVAKLLDLPRIPAFAGRQVGYFFSTEKVTKAMSESQRKRNQKTASSKEDKNCIDTGLPKEKSKQKEQSPL